MDIALVIKYSFWAIGGGFVALSFGAGIAILPLYPYENDPNQGADIGGLLALIGIGALAVIGGIVLLAGVAATELFQLVSSFLT